MSKHVVVGAGGIGRAAARELARMGHEVVLVSRSGRDPHLPGVAAVAAHAASAEQLTALACGADSLINAANPPKYYSWQRDWPPMAAAMLAAAEHTGAGLVTVSNLYLYGRVSRPMTESTPSHPQGTKGEVRARMWEQALEAHEAGRVRATELRASDYFGPGGSSGVSLLNQYVIAPAIRGRRVRLVVGSPDVPHSWTYLPDIGRLAATLATDDRSWGSAWHVPTSAPRTFREVADAAAVLGGHPSPVRIAPLPRVAKALARVSATVRELDETSHQFEAPFELDSRLTERIFGLAPTPWSEALTATVATLQDAPVAAATRLDATHA